MIGDVVYASTLATNPRDGRTVALDLGTGRPLDLPRRALQPGGGRAGPARPDGRADALRARAAVTVARLARAAAIVALLGLLSRLLFAREVVLAAAYGTSGATDAFVNSLLIVNTVAAVLLYTLVTLIIPVFQRERSDHADSAWRLVCALAVWTGLGLVVLASLAAIFPEVPTAVFQLDPARAEDTEELIRIMSPALALQGFRDLHRAAPDPRALRRARGGGDRLQLRDHRRRPHRQGQHRHRGGRMGRRGRRGAAGDPAAAPVLAAAAGGTSPPGPGPSAPRRRRAARAPVLGASVLQQVNNITDKLFASSLEAGRVAALSFANALGQARAPPCCCRFSRRSSP